MSANFSELWRRHTLAYAPIRAIVGNRVYPVHVSGVEDAQFPAISLFTLASVKNNGVVNGQYQMDTWSYSEQEAGLLQDYLEQLYHPLYFSTLPESTEVEVKFIRQLERRDGFFEDDIKLFHKIGIYKVVWQALT
jgi:hypothetical protein